MCLHKITSKEAYFVCRCCVCCAHLRIRRERKETRKERQKRAALCSRLISLTSHVRDGKAFLRQVLDSRWVKRGLRRSQWSRPILTRRHNGVIIHPTCCICLATRQERRNLHETACVLLGCLSPTSPLLYWRSNDPTDNKVPHFGALLNCSALCRSAFQSLQFLFPPADQVTKSKHAAMVDSMMVHHFYTLHSGPSGAR